jgi:tetratricopeptide (TPR) repeat protein
LLVERRRFDDASSRIEALLGRNADSAAAWLLRSELATARGDLVLAEQSYRKTIAVAPGSAAAYHGLAKLLASQRRMDDGLLALDQGSRALPEDLSFPATRAEWLARAGRPDDAIAVYESLIKRAPEDDAYANNLAYLLVESKSDAASLERALALTRRFSGSNNPGYLDSLGWVQYKLGHYVEAIAILERAERRAPAAPLLQLHLGLALYKKGDVVSGAEHLRKALESKPPLPGLDEARRLVAQP